MERAPTMPSERMTFEVIAIMISVVINVIAIRDTPKLAEYMTPLNVFLYTRNINIPRTKARPSAITVSKIENEVTLSRKLVLKMSEKLN
jgi:hypothetical protein